MAQTVQIGSEAWAADLQAFRDAIGSITSDRDAIKGDFDQIISLLQTLGDSWKGPGGLAFSEGIDPLSNAGNQMIDVIGDVISRLGITLHNYENAETTNTQNLSHQPPTGAASSNHSAPAAGRSTGATKRTPSLPAHSALDTARSTEAATERLPLLPAAEA
jgi:uncharacterized protein YukE